MDIRYFIDPETDAPHIHRHDVSESEVEDILARPLEDRPGREDSRVAVGKTQDGRFLRVIYVPESPSGSIFVVTAYDLGPKATKALRRRQRRKR